MENLVGQLLFSVAQGRLVDSKQSLEDSVTEVVNEALGPHEDRAGMIAHLMEILNSKSRDEKVGVTFRNTPVSTEKPWVNPRRHGFIDRSLPRGDWD